MVNNLFPPTKWPSPLLAEDEEELRFACGNFLVVIKETNVKKRDLEDIRDIEGSGKRCNKNYCCNYSHIVCQKCESGFLELYILVFFLHQCLGHHHEWKAVG